MLSTARERDRQQPQHLRGHVALVTGASRGIGLAAAEALAAAGARLAVTDVDRDGLAVAADRLGPDALAATADVSSAEHVQSLIDDVLARFGRLDILVNNAGVLYPTRFVDIPLAEWQRTIEVNLTGTFLCSQAAAVPMRTLGYGRMVNVASSAGRSVSTLGGAHYTASKAGVLGLTRAAAKELAPFGITVNAVCPGLIDTDMVRSSTTPERRDAYARSFPVARLGTVEEVAALICFLASPDAAYITGASIDINGGDLMM
jgi:NAD(P)-dependent dehydrogenase (short-subunit alcohol dehydrogenase family)